MTKFDIMAQTCNPHNLEAEAEACLKFEASLGYIVSSKLAWLMAWENIPKQNKMMKNSYQINLIKEKT